uniref:Uncharacterized protein n=1 Tax=Chlorobium phaeobacteroides (strain BS1) TaxID=331678 RepID=B3EPR2_CHLPB
MQISGFDTSLWVDTDFSKKYRDEADVYLPLRQLFIETTKSLYAHVADDEPYIPLQKHENCLTDKDTEQLSGISFVNSTVDTDTKLFKKST